MAYIAGIHGNSEFVDHCTRAEMRRTKQKMAINREPLSSVRNRPKLTLKTSYYSWESIDTW